MIGRERVGEKGGGEEFSGCLMHSFIQVEKRPFFAFSNF